MNRAEFLNELDSRLRLIPQEDREDAIAYYDEYIGDSGLDENADVTAMLGTPREVANKIITECTEKHARETADIKKPAGTVKSGATTVWLAILGVASLPISLPLLIVVLVTVLVIIIVLFTVILTLWAVSIAGVAGGILTAVAAFFTAGGVNILPMVGLGLVVTGLGVLIGIVTLKLSRLAVKAVASIVTKRR